MSVQLPAEVLTKSKVIYDLGQVGRCGRYVLLIYSVPEGRENEKPFVFRRRLSFGAIKFESYIVQAKLEQNSQEEQSTAQDENIIYESDDSYLQPPSQGTSTVPPSSMPPRRGGSRGFHPEQSVQSALRSKLFWLLMVRFERPVNGHERFHLPVEGLPVCFVKRDLNYAGAEWLEVCQQWMSSVSLPAAQNGFPIQVQGENRKALPERKPNGKATAQTSQYFSGKRREAKRMSPSGASDGMSDDYSPKKPKTASSHIEGGMRQLMMEHRVISLERRVRSLEELLVRFSSS